MQNKQTKDKLLNENTQRQSQEQYSFTDQNRLQHKTTMKTKEVAFIAINNSHCVNETSIISLISTDVYAKNGVNNS